MVHLLQTDFDEKNVVTNTKIDTVKKMVEEKQVEVVAKWQTTLQQITQI